MLALITLFCCLLPAVPQADSRSPPEVSGRYGAYEGSLEREVSPRAVGFDSEGRLFVASEHRVGLYDQDLVPTGSWGRSGDSPGHFRRPGGLAVASNGLVYVSDTGNHRIQMFQTDGTWAGRFGTRGSGDEQFLQPAGLALSEERVFVADSGNNRIQVFDRLGRPIARWYADGLMRPSGVARDAAGHLFIADSGNHRIVVLDESGTVLLSVGERGPFPGLFSEPRGVAVSGQRLYVADTENHRIQVFDIEAVLGGDGQPLYEWGKHALRPREGEGRLHYPDALAVSPDGEQIVVAESFVDRVQVFGPAVEPAAVYAADPTVRTGIAAHYGPSISVLGPLLLLMEPESQTIQVMNVQGMSPVMVTRFGGYGSKPSAYRRLEGVAFGPTGRVYSSDGDTSRIQTWRLHYEHREEAVFRPGASHLVRCVDLSILLGPGSSEATPVAKRWGVSGHVRPGQIVADDDGLIYVIDEVSASVLVFNADWEFQRAIGRGRLRRPLDLALLPVFGGMPSRSNKPDRKLGEQRLAVADGDLGQVLLFGPEGELDAILGAGILVEPVGVTADDEGRVLVTDIATHRVHVFDVTGPELTSWGGMGLAAGQFFKPRGIAVLPSGHILVLDHGNHRGQVFSETGHFESAFGRRLYVDAADIDAALLEQAALQEEQER